MKIKNLTRYHLWLGILFCAFVLTAFSAEIPTIQRRVTDLTGTLSSGDVQTIESELAAFEQETSNQIVVLIVSTIEEGSIEDYSIQVAEKNGIGQKGKNNGILLTVAKDDRKVRIEPGYGLEGALPDAICDQIIRYIIIPSFKQGDYAIGIQKGVEAIMAATKGEFKGDGKQKGSGKISGLIIAIILIIFFFGFFGRRGGGGFNVGGRGINRFPGMWMGGFGGGGFGGGGFGGGGGFSSGGGFSGGGGSFGGGGASGSW